MTCRQLIGHSRLVKPKLRSGDPVFFSPVGHEIPGGIPALRKKTVVCTVGSHLRRSNVISSGQTTGHHGNAGGAAATHRHNCAASVKRIAPTPVPLDQKWNHAFCHISHRRRRFRILFLRVIHCKIQRLLILADHPKHIVRIFLRLVQNRLVPLIRRSQRLQLIQILRPHFRI